MIEWEVGDDHLRVVDADNAEVTVEGRGLTVSGSGPAISRPVDETVEATATRLRFPHAIVYAFSLGRDEQYELDPTGDPLSLPSGEYIVDIDTEIKIYLRFSGSGTIKQADDYEHIELAFPERRRVIFGFRSHHELPAGTITVPPTTEGMATAITHLTSAQKTPTPDRTYPTLRGHPPLVRQGPKCEISDRIETSTPDTGIELLVPDAIEPLFVTAPLAYYLQARVRTTDRETPALRLPDVAREVALSPMPTLERDAERLLRKTFFLDSLVRNAGPYRADLSELSMLDALELDMEALYEATPQQRLATYLDVPHGAIEHRLPTWHLTTYVDPTPSNVELLPFLLDRLSLLGVPRTSELEGKELVERSLEDFYRGPQPRSNPTARAGASQVASVDIVKPELKSSHAHGWLADGVPIDVFKSAAEAYSNRLNYLEDSGNPTSICIVLNDRDMKGEHTDVAEIYRQRSDDLAIDVSVEESLGTAELARVFETDHDFVHYIGHCETDGLRCSNGSLSIDSLDRCNAQTFFLNACGSFYEGMSLIEKGSVAGAVTFTKVLNDHAVKVGSTFAKLLIHGFSIERAMSLARRRIMMGKDYAVVGDGTHSLTQGEHRVPTTATVERLDDDQYLLSLECFSTQMTGLYYYPHVETNEHAYLCGTESSFTLETGELVSFLKESETPVIYDGDVYWSQDLWPTLQS
ncbi:hypothetical protein [Halomontanus rarus]|uniref:hypothetical protein n=1 Tax=Halomontanus rarus TaxID=3034020 RepID=UPI0023E8421D|nr:hypothetical protein [Halovivax sp. TS33]